MAACLEQRRKGKETAVIRCQMSAVACGGFSTGVNREDRRAFLAEYEGGRNMADDIFVTRSSMPPYDEYAEAIRPLWESRWITNMGLYHAELEARLREYLGVDGLSLCVNGHMALELTIQAMDFPEGSRSNHHALYVHIYYSRHNQEPAHSGILRRQRERRHD